MRDKEQEPFAARIAGLFAHMDSLGWEWKYPEVYEIVEIATDLEWSNVDNTTIQWRRIMELLTALDRRVDKLRQIRQ